MTTVVIKKKLKEYILNLNFLRIVGFALLKIYVSITNQRRKKMVEKVRFKHLSFPLKMGMVGGMIYAILALALFFLALFGGV